MSKLIYYTIILSFWIYVKFSQGVGDTQLIEQNPDNKFQNNF